MSAATPPFPLPPAGDHPQAEPLTLRVLVVDDDPEMAELLAEILGHEGYTARTAQGGREALWMMNSVHFPLVITDLRMHGMSGMELLAEIRAAHPRTDVVMITAFGSIDTAIEAIQGGAYDYITKPFKTEAILAVVRRAAEKIGLKNQLRRLAGGPDSRFHGMLGASAAMRRVFDHIRQVAASPASVLLTGESGTGKEMAARALHAESRRGGPLVPVNCAAIPESLMEGELFGARKGAYTDAREDRKGLFEHAAGGTLFLDEVGEIPLILQGKLLRVLQERVVRRLGDTREIPVDVRIVAATNTDLKAAVEAGRFRDDLYWRLNVIPIHLPPLRQRTEDIPLLAEALVARFAHDNGKPVAGLESAALEQLAAHPWPGNIRELANALERAVILCRGPRIGAEDLPMVPPESPHPLRRHTDAPPGAAGDAPDRESATSPPPATGMLPAAALAGTLSLDALERHYILKVLADCGGHRTVAAHRLGIDRKTLYRKLARYGLEGEGEDGDHA
ncbi:MAG: sigma-54 dependent transcriptional regulator [Nitrospirota bacterium]|nr:sigma-54 dependent transcriptional regulator [Nitrospirota bacterium]